MAKTIFNLTSGSEFITLDKLLKVLRLVNSGGEAHRVIQEGLVSVNSEVEIQKRKKVKMGDVIEFNGKQVEIKS